MPRSNTGPELALRRELHARGLRFRVTVKSLPGTPDLAFSRVRLAVFVDGCFWHGCPEHHVAPKNNGPWWAAKIETNRARDARVDLALRELGWEVLHIWEHEPAAEAADRVESEWKHRRQS
jgi:DNA mismatch endonuclease (patch repair protein)